ncbi:hypothetical protein D9611_007604 [Ephemerocybe angulata]|uniref:Histone H4 n=1 Tax=Ephemerocybe angulata TaxID=980116 RepID=A0A8H5BXV2_9AGAR|nr:hypothetical protein D9611_007604 [Tulosesus angulatus]
MSGRGKGGKGLGKGGAKRHRKILHDNIQVRPSVYRYHQARYHRLARRGGVKRISSLIYEETGGVLKIFLENVIRDSITYTEHAKRKTVTCARCRLCSQALRPHSLRFRCLSSRLHTDTTATISTTLPLSASTTTSTTPVIPPITSSMTTSTTLRSVMTRTPPDLPDVTTRTPPDLPDVTVTSTTSTQPLATSSAASSDKNVPTAATQSIGTIIGIVAGLLGGLILIAVIAGFIVRRMRIRRRNREAFDASKFHKSALILDEKDPHKPRPPSISTPTATPRASTVVPPATSTSSDSPSSPGTRAACTEETASPCITVVVPDLRDKERHGHGAHPLSGNKRNQREGTSSTIDIIIVEQRSPREGGRGRWRVAMGWVEQHRQCGRGNV